MSNYKKISNSPEIRYNTSWPYALWDDVFTESELDKIEVYCNSLNLSEGVHIQGADNPTEYTHRKSKTAFMQFNDTNSWIFERMNAAIELINENYFNYDLNGYSNMQYSEYDGSSSDRYNYHADIMFGIQHVEPQTRKLSITLLLNSPSKDFTGGEFGINYGDESLDKTGAYKVEMKRGRIIAFPSYMIHKVFPVITGKRKSIVIWVTGPKFR